MRKSKLQRFEEIGDFDHVFELTDYQEDGFSKPKGRWQEDIFQNKNPIILELACGKGEYTIELADRYPESNCIGIDIKGARIWKGAKRALNRELTNVRFLRIYIDHLTEYFGKNEIDEIWITFPDPYPRDSKESKRLTSPKFLTIYQRVLKNGGFINFKTDNKKLFNYTKEILDKYNCKIIDLSGNIYQEYPEDTLLTLKTHYERQHLKEGRTIKYIKFKLPKKTIKY